MNTRDSIFRGEIELPAQIINLVGAEYASVMHRMFQAIWTNFIKNKRATSTVYWYEQFNNDIVFNNFMMHLSKSGWIIATAEPMRNWAEVVFNEAKLLKWITADEVTSMRRYAKFHDYKMLTANMYVSGSNTFNRPGIAKHDTSAFQYDTKYISKYFDSIVLNTTKSIRMLALDSTVFADDTYYETISTYIVEYHMYSPEEYYILGHSASDSRGRAISSALSKVFNPIGYKDARALLVGPSRALSLKGWNQVYLAIAELLGDKSSTLEAKILVALDAISTRRLHDLDLCTEEGRKDLYENIWLERIYDNLAIYNGHNWTVPLELDASASMLQIEGVLLDHTPFLEMTNVLDSDNLIDPWAFNSIPRAQFKKAMTPMLYGSSKTCDALWNQNNIAYTSEQVKLFSREISIGALSVANDFKEFIIANVVPQESLEVSIWNEVFTVQCNRYSNKGDYTKQYNVYDTNADKVKTIYHTHTHREADLEQFRRYFVTLLVHNLDSRIADEVANSVSWCIPIYDAFIVMPDEAVTIRETYTQQLDKLYIDRTDILRDYFQSIGIDSTNMQAWTNLKAKCIPVVGDFKAQYTALK